MVDGDRLRQRATGGDALERTGDALTLHVACSDGSVAVTWWNLSEMPRFLTRVGVDATPRPAGAALQ
jgi:hypothetical protein